MQKIDQNSAQILIECLSTIRDSSTLEKYSFSLLMKLRGVNPQSMDQYFLHNILSNFMALVVSMERKGILKDKTFSLIEYLLEKELVPKIYYRSISRLYEDTQSSLFKIETRKPNQINKILKPKEYESNLDTLLRMEIESGLSYNQNFGYSILDLNGDFIWLDEKSQRFLEYKFDEPQNFFRLLIPFSVQQLLNRFGVLENNENSFVEIFANKSIGDSVAFSYIIYSKKNMKKYIKQLKKNKKSMIYAEKKNFKNLFYKYLKGLSSRASLILMKFNFKELKGCFRNDIKINFSNSMKNLFKNDANILEEDKNKYFYQTFILLETRYSKNIPHYDFNNMKIDPKIKEFEKYVKDKAFK